jgi:hypothetical protein
MGRRKTSRVTSVLCLAGLSSFTACTLPAQTASIPAGTAPPAAAPQNLIGSTPQILTAEFGQPALVRVDGTAQVWLYQTPNCGLNLILYPDTAGVPRVAMATTADGSTVIGDCPASLQQSHLDAESGIPAPVLAAPAITALEPPASS